MFVGIVERGRKTCPRSSCSSL